jgi:hypothetical protein
MSRPPNPNLPRGRRITTRATVDTLHPDQVADLEGINKDPHHPLVPVRRQLFKRLQLIRVVLNPSDKKSRPTKGPHELTEIGRAALAKHSHLLQGAKR